MLQYSEIIWVKLVLDKQVFVLTGFFVNYNEFTAAQAAWKC
jgi:hypothetical protein